MSNTRKISRRRRKTASTADHHDLIKGDTETSQLNHDTQDEIALTISKETSLPTLLKICCNYFQKNDEQVLSDNITPDVRKIIHAVKERLIISSKVYGLLSKVALSDTQIKLLYKIDLIKFKARRFFKNNVDKQFSELVPRIISFNKGHVVLDSEDDTSTISLSPCD